MTWPRKTNVLEGFLFLQIIFQKKKDFIEKCRI